jgi:hypothetical protein
MWIRLAISTFETVQLWRKYGVFYNLDQGYSDLHNEVNRDKKIRAK